MGERYTQRLRELVRDRERLRRHNRGLINLLDHYYEMTSHYFSEKRAEKRAHALPPPTAKRDYSAVAGTPILIHRIETNQEFADRMKGKR
jgi:hypothetical protein